MKDDDDVVVVHPPTVGCTFFSRVEHGTRFDRYPHLHTTRRRVKMTDAVVDYEQHYRHYMKHALCARTMTYMKRELFAYVHNLALKDETLSLVTMPLTAVVHYRQLRITTRSFDQICFTDGVPNELMYHVDTERMTLPQLRRCRVCVGRQPHAFPVDGLSQQQQHTSGIPQTVCDQLCVVYKDIRRNQLVTDAMNYLVVADIEVDDEFVTLDAYVGQESAWSVPPEVHTRRWWDCLSGAADDDISLLCEKTTPRVTAQ